MDSTAVAAGKEAEMEVAAMAAEMAEEALEAPMGAMMVEVVLAVDA